MKNKKRGILAIIVAAVMIFAIGAFTACNGGDYGNGNGGESPRPVAIEVEASRLQLSLDSATAAPANERTQAIVIADFINANEAEGVTYTMVVTQGAGHVTISALTTTGAQGPRFNLTGNSVGTSTVELRASMEGEVVVTVTFTVNVFTSVFGITNSITPNGFTLVDVPESARLNQPVTFSIAIGELHMAGTAVTLTYQVAGSAEATVAGVIAGSNITFTIPAAQITGALTLRNISGVIENDAPRINVEGLDLAGDFTLVGAANAFLNRDYTLTVRVPNYYTGATISYRFGTGAIQTRALTNPIANGADLDFAFTVTQAALNAVPENAVLIITGVELELGTTNFIDAFWDTTHWEAMNGGQTGTAPILAGNTLTFTGNPIRNNYGDVSGTHISTTASSTNWYQISFEANVTGVLDMLFFKTNNIILNAEGNWTGGNMVRLTTAADGTVSLAIGQGAANPMASSAAGAFVPGEWTRFDIVYSRVAGVAGHNSPGQVELRLLINGERVFLEPTEHNYPSVTVANGSMTIDVGAPNYGHRVAVNAGSSPLMIRPVAVATAE